MAFTFEITGISKFAKAHVGVLDGKLIEGSVTTGATAKLFHGAQQLPVRVKGVVLDSTHPENGVLSLTVDLRESAMAIASIGDRLVCP